MKRALVALFVVSIAAPLVILVMGGDHARGGAIGVAAYTVPATFILGLPAVIAFSRRGWLKWWHAASAGAGVGAICAVPFIVGGLPIALPILLFFISSWSLVYSIANGTSFQRLSRVWILSLLSYIGSFFVLFALAQVGFFPK